MENNEDIENEQENLDEYLMGDKLVINWFPGHMHRTRKLITKNISYVDMVIEMRDARIPLSSENPLLQELTTNKPSLVLLNKADLADEGVTKEWMQLLKRENRMILAVNSTDPKLRNRIVAACKQLLPDFNRVGRTRIRAMITGIPNVGKSTLLNTISATSKAKTGDRPAITTDLQNVRVPGGVDLIDTPGVLWPKIETEGQGVRLSAVGSIKDSVVDLYRIAVRVAEILMENYPKELKVRYKLETLPQDGVEMIACVGKKRGCIQLGGVTDLERAALCFLNEFRDGRIGRISLERPEQIAQSEGSGQSNG